MPVVSTFLVLPYYKKRKKLDKSDCSPTFYSTRYSVPFCTFRLRDNYFYNLHRYTSKSVHKSSTELIDDAAVATALHRTPVSSSQVFFSLLLFFFFFSFFNSVITYNNENYNKNILQGKSVERNVQHPSICTNSVVDITRVHDYIYSYFSYMS